MSEDMADAIATWEVRQRAFEAISAGLKTTFDPRRDAHELYRINIPNVTDQELWEPVAWRFDLRVGATMEHQLIKVSGYPDPGLILLETSDDIP